MVAKELRCIGCGKPIESGVVFQILKGRLVKQTLQVAAGTQFGCLHEECFQRLVADPRSVMEQLKKASKRPK